MSNFLKSRASHISRLICEKEAALSPKHRTRGGTKRKSRKSLDYQSLLLELGLLKFLMALEPSDSSSSAYLSDSDPLASFNLYCPFTPAELEDLWLFATDSEDLEAVQGAWLFVEKRLMEELGNGLQFQVALQQSLIYNALLDREELLLQIDEQIEIERLRKWHWASAHWNRVQEDESEQRALLSNDLAKLPEWRKLSEQLDLEELKSRWPEEDDDSDVHLTESPNPRVYLAAAAVSLNDTQNQAMAAN